MNSKVRLIAISWVGALAGLTLLTLALTPNTPVQAIMADPSVFVSITESGFDPSAVTITAGTAVVWTNHTQETVHLVSGEPHRIYLPLVLRSVGREFVLDAWPAIQTITQGHSITYTVAVTAVRGFTRAVTLDVGGIPTGAAASWAANPLTPTADTTLTITSSVSSPTGTFTLVITGTGGGQVHTTTAALSVTPFPDFALGVQPPMREVAQGKSVTYTVALKALHGFADPVALAVGGAPTDTTVSWAANPLTPTADTTLSITPSVSSPTGTFTLVITGTGGGQVHTTTAALSVTPFPDFALGVQPPMREVAQGKSVTYTVALTALHGFADPVALAVGGAPTDTTVSWAANPLTPTADTTLIITPSVSSPTGMFTLVITGTGGGQVHTTTATMARPSPDDYEAHKALLPTRAGQPFADDPMRDVETDLDRRPYHQINELACPKPIDNAEGWSVIFRTGGRPFMNFDSIWLNGAAWDFEPCTPGESGIPQSELDDHYAAGKRVNRIWFIHRATNGWPILLVMTPDGFFNPAGAKAPMLQGAAARMGFIGEPFSDNEDYLQHVDEVSITEVDTDTLIVLYNIHSEAGEGVLEFELKWIAATEQPELHFRSAHVPRLDARLGFAGLNFMRGPTLSGLDSTGVEGGIEAFHDGRSVFVVHKSGSITRNVLVPPVITATVVREEVAADVVPSAKLVMDQPQNVQRYFSKFPDPRYDERTDLILKLDGSTVERVRVRRAQVAVDLADPNPEANETVNVFYAADMTSGQLYEFWYTLGVAATDFEQLYQARSHGVVFVSDRCGAGGRLYFLPLDADFLPAGPAEPLTDGVITDPHRLSVSADGRFIIFDADDYKASTRQRVYTLDLASAAVRRLTVDPYGHSDDRGASFNAEGSHFAMITDRPGTPYVDIEDVATGLGPGFGNSVEAGSSADWSHTRNEIAFASNWRLKILDVDNDVVTDVISGAGISTPRFSPSGESIAYAAGTDLYVVDRHGISITKVLTDCEYPTWVDETRWIVHCEVNGNTDLYLVSINTGDATQLTLDPAVDAEPAFVGSIGPTMTILSPEPGAQVPPSFEVSGLVASAGAPTVTIDGATAEVEGDRWWITLTLGTGTYTLTAEATDSATGLVAQDEVTVTVAAIPPADVVISGPAVGAVQASYVFTADVTSVTVTLPITPVWWCTGCSPVTHTGSLSRSNFRAAAALEPQYSGRSHRAAGMRE